MCACTCACVRDGPTENRFLHAHTHTHTHIQTHTHTHTHTHAHTYTCTHTRRTTYCKSTPHAHMLDVLNLNVRVVGAIVHGSPDKTYAFLVTHYSKETNTILEVRLLLSFPPLAHTHAHTHTHTPSTFPRLSAMCFSACVGCWTHKRFCPSGSTYSWTTQPRFPCIFGPCRITAHAVLSSLGEQEQQVLHVLRGAGSAWSLQRHHYFVPSCWPYVRDTCNSMLLSCSLVCNGTVVSMDLCRRHEDVDQRFSLISKELMRTPCRTIPELIASIRRAVGI